jgi:hypothetical protein
MLGHSHDAIAFYQRSLDGARHTGDLATIMHNLWSLGTLYEAQGDLAVALPLMEEAAQIAERIGMPWAAQYRAKAEELRAGGGAERPGG